MPIPPVASSMRPILIALLTALCFVPVHAAEQMEAPKDRMVLIVSGDIHNINRRALDLGNDSLLALQKVDFQRAFAFDRPMLLRLKQGAVRAQPPELNRPATFTDPLLTEVLASGARQGPSEFSRRGRL
jgi:hypothetical protein